MKRTTIHTTKTLLATAALAGIMSSGFLANAAVTKNTSNTPGVLADDKKNDHACKGKNECKGKGGCKAGDAGCAGKNSCKGKGGCGVKDGKPTH